MHILFFSQYFPPEVHAPASRTYDHCKQWISKGHKVTVITVAPNHPKGKIYKGYKNKLWQSEVIDGIEVIRVWSLISPNKGLFRRIIGYMTFFPTSIITGIFVRDVDLIIGTSPQIFSPLAAWIVSFFKRTPWIFEIRDILSESLKAVNLINNHFLLNFLEKFEIFLYKRADSIVVVTNGFKQTLVDQGINIDKIKVVTNGVNLDKFKVIEKDADLLNSLDMKDCFVAGYIGTHGLAHGLDTILYAAKDLQDIRNTKNIKFLFLGDGANKKSLVSLSKELNLNNVIFLDTVPRDQVHLYWSILDVSIIHLRKTKMFNTFIPSKIFECMAMGIPLLHCVAGESSHIVSSNKIGRIIEGDNKSLLVSNILEMSQNELEMTGYRRACIESSKKYNRENLSEKMLKIFENLL